MRRALLLLCLFAAAAAAAEDAAVDEDAQPAKPAGEVVVLTVRGGSDHREAMAPPSVLSSPHLSGPFESWGGKAQNTRTSTFPFFFFTGRQL